MGTMSENNGILIMVLTLTPLLALVLKKYFDDNNAEEAKKLCNRIAKHNEDQIDLSLKREKIEKNILDFNSQQAQLDLNRQNILVEIGEIEKLNTHIGENVKNEVFCSSPLECFISFNFNNLVLVLVLVLFFLFFIYQIFIKNLIQFDIVSNYCVIQIFFLFFFACYTSIIISLNDHKFVNLLKSRKIKNNLFYSFSDMLGLVPKLKNFLIDFIFKRVVSVLYVFLLVISVSFFTRPRPRKNNNDDEKKKQKPETEEEKFLRIGNEMKKRHQRENHHEEVAYKIDFIVDRFILAFKRIYNTFYYMFERTYGFISSLFKNGPEKNLDPDALVIAYQLATLGDFSLIIGTFTAFSFLY